MGGVAHNSSLNGLLLRSGRFEEIFVHPVSHNAGAAEGAALTAAQQLGPSRPGAGGRPGRPRMRSAGVGPGLGTAPEIEVQLTAWRDLVEYSRPADIVAESARLPAGGLRAGLGPGPVRVRAPGARQPQHPHRPVAAGNKQRNKRQARAVPAVAGQVLPAAT